MTLWRVYPSLTGAAARAAGGFLHTPRDRQGQGRHDNPAEYGALYLARDPESAVAESIARWRGSSLSNRELEYRDGSRLSLAAIDDRNLPLMPDLDDPGTLVARGLRPSRIATRERLVTQPIALSLFREGHVGFAWWSTLEASFSNVTLFAERAVGRLRLERPIETLTIDHPNVRSAAELLGVRLDR